MCGHKCLAATQRKLCCARLCVLCAAESLQALFVRQKITAHKFFRKLLRFCQGHGKMRTVNRLHLSRPQMFLRRTALLLALIFLSISGGTTLTHTEDNVFGSVRVHAGASVLAHSVSAAGADFCAACQWESSVFSPQAPSVALPAPMFVVLPTLVAGPQVQFPHPFDHTSPRAPPRVS